MTQNSNDKVNSFEEVPWNKRLVAEDRLEQGCDDSVQESSDLWHLRMSPGRTNDGSRLTGAIS